MCTLCIPKDTDYEFRVRAENVAGSSRDVISHCRINASCPAPQHLDCAYIGTAHVDLEWIRPSKIGNEVTKDAYQIHTESIQKYVATLRVVEQHPEDRQDKDFDREDSNLDSECLYMCLRMFIVVVERDGFVGTSFSRVVTW